MATADVSYVPGALTAVAGDQCWALVEVSPDFPAVGRIWQQLGQGVAADALLAALIANGMGGTPGFTLLMAESGGRHRLFCRGTVGATVVTRSAGGGAPQGQGQAAAERIDGAGLLTWREQVVGDAERIFLGEPPADTAMRLPAVSGVLLAGCVVVDLASVTARDTVFHPRENRPAPEPPGKTADFYTGPITMAHPGRLAEPGAAGPPDGTVAAFPAAFSGSPAGLPAVPPAAGPAGDGDLVPPGPISPGSASAPGEYPGAGPQPRAQHQPTEYQPAEYPPGPYQAAPPTAPSWPPAPGDAWPDGSRAPATAPVPASMPLPAPPPGLPAVGVSGVGLPGVGRPANGGSPSPAGDLSGVPQWLSNPSGPVPSRSVPPGLPTPGAVPDGTPPASTAPDSTGPGGPAPDGPAPAEPPYQAPAPHAGPGPGESGFAVQPGERTIPPDRIGPVVPALLCPSGHVNPPSDMVCRRCGAPLPHDPVPVPRPVLGVLRLSLGDVITLDRGVLMGRNPRTDFADADGFGGPAGGERPHVVRLPTGDGDISRTHLRVTLDGWHVLVTDLNSTNGTLVTPPGQETLRLRPGEPLPIQSGTVVTLADGIDFRYEASE